MSIHPFSVKFVFSVLVTLLVAMSGSVLAKTYKVDCDKKSDLQKMIDGAVEGDTIEITGICMENILIEDQALRLVAADSPGPHGITGVMEGLEAVRIINSRGTLLEGLQISNPHSTGVRIIRHSDVTMRDCEVSNSSAGAATGIWVQELSILDGTRLRLDDNLRGLAAYKQSQAYCKECDLNGNRQASLSWKNSTVSLLDSTVTGPRGIVAFEGSYIDIDCLTHDSEHDCSLNVASYSGWADIHSQVAFYHSGDFSGWVRALDRSKVHLLGARQQTNSRQNEIGDNSSLRVESIYSTDPNTGDQVLEELSRVTGDTYIYEFSNALFYGPDTQLTGDLTCNSGGDAIVETGIDMTGLNVHGDCPHVPVP